MTPIRTKLKKYWAFGIGYHGKSLHETRSRMASERDRKDCIGLRCRNRVKRKEDVEIRCTDAVGSM